MRTIRIKFIHTMTPTLTVALETDEIVADDEDVHEVGRRAALIIDQVFDGIAEGAGELEE